MTYAASLMNLPTREKIETIILCYLRGGKTTKGRFGKLEKLARGYRVTADGKTVIAFTTKDGWQVNYAGKIGNDRELIQAAGKALGEVANA